jgi:hypothetical protein
MLSRCFLTVPTRYPKAFGDLGVRPALGNEIQDLALARSSLEPQIGDARP